MCKGWMNLQQMEYKKVSEMSDSLKKEQPVNQDKIQEQDEVMEQILDNINSTPIGKVLKNIASLPEVRKDKVLGVRERLNKGDYDLNGRLDQALDKVLEDLTG